MPSAQLVVEKSQTIKAANFLDTLSGNNIKKDVDKNGCYSPFNYFLIRLYVKRRNGKKTVHMIEELHEKCPDLVNSRMVMHDIGSDRIFVNSF